MACVCHTQTLGHSSSQVEHIRAPTLLHVRRDAASGQKCLSRAPRTTPRTAPWGEWGEGGIIQFGTAIIVGAGRDTFNVENIVAAIGRRHPHGDHTSRPEPPHALCEPRLFPPLAPPAVVSSIVQRSRAAAIPSAASTPPRGIASAANATPTAPHIAVSPICTRGGHRSAGTSAKPMHQPSDCTIL
eukprot:scaffold10393_cov114-Isochrysis_galbana.AAC.9